MAGFIEIILLILWGGVLGFFYQLISFSVRRHRNLTYLLWGIGGIIFFLATAIFLFYLNQGAVGFYGFPFMVLGFSLYLHFLCRKTSRALHPVAGVLNGLLQVLYRTFGFCIKIIFLPLSALVNMAEAVISLLISPIKSLVLKRRDQRHENMNNVVEEEV